MPTKTPAYAALTKTSPVAPFTVDRRDPLPRDVQMDILYCGVCHSDLHLASRVSAGVGVSVSGGLGALPFVSPDSSGRAFSGVPV